MSFLLKIPHNPFKEITSAEKLTEINDGLDNENLLLFFDKNPGGSYKKVVDEEKIWFFVGDFIIPKKYRNNASEYLLDFARNFSSQQLRTARGNFYLICVNTENATVSVYNSIMSILPVYCYQSGEVTFISSRMDFIVEASGDVFKINKKYIVEHLLFGYGFKD
ncbi:MAG: hypothetical protein ACP5DQ_13200, partial [Bacteroidales bacterium]